MTHQPQETLSSGYAPPAPERPFLDPMDARSYLFDRVNQYVGEHGEEARGMVEEYFTLCAQLRDESILAPGDDRLFSPKLAVEDLANITEYLKIGVERGIPPVFIEALYGIEDARWGTLAARISPSTFLPVFRQAPQLIQRYTHIEFTGRDSDEHQNDPEHVLSELQQNAEYFRALNEKYSLGSMTEDEYEKPVGSFCDGMTEVWIGKLQTGRFTQNPAVIVTVRPKTDEYGLDAYSQGFRIYQDGTTEYASPIREQASYTLSPSQSNGFEREELTRALLDFNGRDTNGVDEVLLDYITR